MSETNLDGHGVQAVAMQRTTEVVTATIANGAALSGVLDIGGMVLSAIQMPAAWTAAALTFQGSNDGSTFGDVYDDAGTELSVAVGNVAASRVIVNASLLEKLAALRYIKIRSGVTATPVNQGAERILTLILKG